MKKVLLMVMGIMLIAATVEAGCGSDACGAAAKKADKAACSLKSKSCDDAASAVCDVKDTCKTDAAKEKAACKLKSSQDKAACELKAGKTKACTVKTDAKDNASEKAQEVRKKWWKFWGGEEAPAE